jgi:hypothetical protein
MKNFVEVDRHNENCKDGYIFPRPDLPRKDNRYMKLEIFTYIYVYRYIQYNEIHIHREIYLYNEKYIGNTEINNE